MTTPLACNLPNQETMSVIEEKEDTGMVESSIMGSIDTRLSRFYYLSRKKKKMLF